MDFVLLIIGASYHVAGMDDDVFELVEVHKTGKQLYLRRKDTGRIWAFGPDQLTLTERSADEIRAKLAAA